MKGKILFVDDDALRTRSYMEMLHMEGYEVTQVQNLKEAQELFKNKRAELNLIILDIMFPYEHYFKESVESRKRGIAFLKQVRAERNKEQLPVVILTVRSDEETIKECLDAGCNEYLEKPCLPSKLLQTVKKYL